MTDRYKKLEDYPTYRIYSNGRVYNEKTGKFLKVHFDSCGYRHVTLYKGTKKSRKTFKVHRLVAQVFIPNPLNLPEVNHKDENKSNNDVSNLEWCTRKYNCEYSAHLHYREEICAIPYEAVKLLPELINRGCSIKLVAQLFKTSHITVRYIINGRRYKHLNLKFDRVPFNSGIIEIPTDVYNKLQSFDIDNTVLSNRLKPIDSVTHSS